MAERPDLVATAAQRRRRAGNLDDSLDWRDLPGTQTDNEAWDILADSRRRDDAGLILEMRRVL